MIRPEQPEPIEGLYDALCGLALQGREQGGGTLFGALSVLPEGTRDYLTALSIPEHNIDGILLGLAWGISISEQQAQ
jgi:hypothetical protein